MYDWHAEALCQNNAATDRLFLFPYYGKAMERSIVSPTIWIDIITSFPYPVKENGS
jgi:hypothetical protein